MCFHKYNYHQILFVAETYSVSLNIINVFDKIVHFFSNLAYKNIIKNAIKIRQY